MTGGFWAWPSGVWSSAKSQKSVRVAAATQELVVAGSLVGRRNVSVGQHWLGKLASSSSIKQTVRHASRFTLHASHFCVNSPSVPLALPQALPPNVLLTFSSMKQALLTHSLTLSSQSGTHKAAWTSY